MPTSSRFKTAEIPYDPSTNVRALVEAEVKRLDDLLASEIGGLRREVANQVEFNKATRAHDLLAQKTADERHQAGVVQLSHTIEQTAETLRRAVSETATNLAQQTGSSFERLSARVSEVEKNQYQDQGKSRVADPQIAQLLSAVQSLQESQAITSGRGAGQSSIWGYISLAMGFLLAAGTIIGWLTSR